MKVGSYEIPDSRLVPSAIADAKKIYDVIKTGQIKTSEIGKVFGYKNYATGVFYRRLNSMVGYGLIKKISSTSYQITDLGTGLCYPDPAKEQVLKNRAVLNVELWSKLLEKCGKDLPSNNFWIQLQNIAKMEPQEAQKMESQIKKWYVDDIALVTLDPLGHPIIDDGTNNSNPPEQKPDGKDLRLGSPQIKPEVDEDMETISFDRYQVSLPKGDLKKEWNKLKKYMDIKLEDYEYKEPELYRKQDEELEVITNNSSQEE